MYLILYWILGIVIRKKNTHSSSIMELWDWVEAVNPIITQIYKLWSVSTKGSNFGWEGSSGVASLKRHLRRGLKNKEVFARNGMEGRGPRQRRLWERLRWQRIGWFWGSERRLVWLECGEFSKAQDGVGEVCGALRLGSGSGIYPNALPDRLGNAMIWLTFFEDHCGSWKEKTEEEDKDKSMQTS